MKKLLLTLMAALMAVTAANASIFDKYTLKRSELPEEAQTMLCLLYTSDAADDLLTV